MKLKSDYKVLLENFFSLSALQIVGYILPLITIPYLVRVLGVDKYGLVSFATAFLVYFQILTDYGFNLSATKEISVHRDDQTKLSEIFSSVMTIKIILMIISFLILYLIVFSFEKFTGDWQIYFLAFGIVIGNLLFPIWFFQGMERMKYITLLNIIANIIFTISIFAFIKNTSDYVYVPLFNSLGTIVAGIISIGIIFKIFGIRFVIPSTESLHDTFKESTDYFLSRASVSIYTSSNAFFLGLFTNNMAVGYYSAAEKIYSAAQGLYYPVGQVIYPYMVKSKNKSFYRRVFKSTVFFNVILCCLIFVLSLWIVNFLYGNNFQESAMVLRIFAVALLVTIPSQLLGYPFLAALGLQKYANGSVIIGSVFHLVILLLLIPIMNIYIVAGLVVVTEIIVLLIRLYGVKKHKLWW
ncbi:flippase [Methanobacterium formicicum]|jgi:PST family polysaccharide transporter|uniref:Polysaccharide biosynthesis protein n=2 Tax=Methanobacterium formicicum TaxID=2162 RepID=A0A0S4FQ25_METFO|nr:flippase [Methanobacterium formicicum]CEL25137.1 polysaccharide biosynthesis protein [Methanobacterium formicicum]